MVDGVSVPGVAALPGSVSGKVEVSGLANVLASDTNNVTALGGTSSAVLAGSFFYGGDPATVTIKAGSPLVQGKNYVVSTFSVGWDAAPTARQVTFHSGSDQLSVNQNMFGQQFGVRVDYAFTAGAGDQTVTIDRDVLTGTFHLYAVALRAVPDALVVTSTADSGAGSLRAVVTSVTGATPATITFAPGLSGQTIKPYQRGDQCERQCHHGCDQPAQGPHDPRRWHEPAVLCRQWCAAHRACAHARGWRGCRATLSGYGGRLRIRARCGCMTARYAIILPAMAAELWTMAPLRPASL